MAIEDLIRPVANIADDIPTILRAATGHKGTSSDGVPPAPEMPKPSWFSGRLSGHPSYPEEDDSLQRELTIRQILQALRRQPRKMASADLGERVLLRQALRAYLSR